MRNRLLGIMLTEKLRRENPRHDEDDTRLNPADRSTAYARLRETALTGNAAFFQTALADALAIDFATARALTGSSDTTPLITALREPKKFTRYYFEQDADRDAARQRRGEHHEGT